MTIGKLNVILSASTRRFSRALRRAMRPVKALARGIQTMTMRVGMMGMALTAVGSAALILMTRRALKTIDAMGKLSARIGETVENLQALHHLADLTGSSAGQMDKALEIMVRRLGETTTGAGEATRGLEMLGMKAEDLLKLSPAEAFRVIAERISKLATAGERAAAAYYLMGRQGMQLLNAMAAGSKGFDDARKFIEDIGGAISNIEAKRVEHANDAMTRLKLVVEAIANRLAVKLAPYLEGAANYFTQLAKEGGGAGAIVDRAWGLATETLRIMGNVLDTIRINWLAFVETITRGAIAVSKAFIQFGPGFEDYQKELALADIHNELTATLDNILKAQDELTNKLANKGGTGDRIVDWLEELRRAGEEAMKAIGGDGNRFKPLTAGVEEALKAQEKLERRGKAIAESLRTPMEVYEATIGELDQLLKAGAISWEIYGRGVQKAKEALESATKAAKESKEQLPQALVRGTAAEISYRNQMEAQRQSKQGIEAVAQGMDENNQWQRQIAEILKRIHNNIDTPIDFIGAN